MTKTEMQEKITFHRAALASLRAAYLALADGGVQSYSIGSRSLTKFDLAKISDEIASHEKAIIEISAMMNGRSRRRAVGIVPRDW